jgi:hypothetical protein
VFNGNGEPKTQQVWRFVFKAPQPDGGHHVVIGPVILPAGKQKLVEALTGMQVATQIDLPPGIEL